MVCRMRHTERAGCVLGHTRERVEPDFTDHSASTPPLGRTAGACVCESTIVALPTIIGGLEVLCEFDPSRTLFVAVAF